MTRNPDYAVSSRAMQSVMKELTETPPEELFLSDVSGRVDVGDLIKIKWPKSHKGANGNWIVVSVIDGKAKIRKGWKA